MRTIRQLYFYAVSLISVEVIIWGIILLLRTTLSQGLVIPNTATLAGGLALVLVGLPIFLVHWLWGQRAAAKDEDEQTASLRAIFLYAVLLGTLIPVVQNALAVINRALLLASGAEITFAIIGQNETTLDNGIAIAINLVAAAYFWTVLRQDWLRISNPINHADVRRLYRFIWLAYGLGLLIFGTQIVIDFIFTITSSTILGFSGREKILNGLSLIVIGAPLWLYTWKTCQDALKEPAEQQSTLRLGLLYLLALSGVLVVLGSAIAALYTALDTLLGNWKGLPTLLDGLSGPLSLGIPFGVVWAYYGKWFDQEVARRPEESQQAGIRRLFAYVLAPLGLATAVIGISLLVSFTLTLLLNNFLQGDYPRQQLAAALSALLVGLPLWLTAWLPMQQEALRKNDLGDLARQSLVRRIYLYLVIFASVIGLMISGGMLLYTLLAALFQGNIPENFLFNVLNIAQNLGIFVVLLVYHLLTLRSDGSHAVDSLAERHKNFPVLVFEHENSGFGARIKALIQKQAADMPVGIQSMEQAIGDGSENASAVVLPAELALNQPEALRLWLKEYQGVKILVPGETDGWVWNVPKPAEAEAQTAQALRQLANGEKLRSGASGQPLWQIAAYVLAVLFLLQVCFFVVMIGVSLIFSAF